MIEFPFGFNLLRAFWSHTFTIGTYFAKAYLVRNRLISGDKMDRPSGNLVFTSKEATEYLKISKPTYLKLIRRGLLRAAKVGKGWRVLKSELDRFLRGETF